MTPLALEISLTQFTRADEAIELGRRLPLMAHLQPNVTFKRSPLISRNRNFIG